MTGMGIGSKIHHVTQIIVMAAVQQAKDSQPVVYILRKAPAASRGPSKSAKKFFLDVTAQPLTEKQGLYTLGLLISCGGMAGSIFWYDLETTGTDSVLDRPLQFAGIRTDLSLDEIAKPVNILGYPGRDVVPQPRAMLVTGIKMSDVIANGLNEKSFCEQVLKELEIANTCTAGFNNIRFDDEFVRQMLYRNFRDPYAREWRNGNSRWDVIDLFRAAYALRPTGFEWPEKQPGIPSFRLEDLALANGIEHRNAHDALADVRATISIAKRLKQAQPRLYEFAWRLREKKAVIQQLYPLGKQPVIHISSMYPAAKGCAAVVLPLCQHPSNSNAIICVDLSQSIDRLLYEDASGLARLIFANKDGLKEGEERLALQSIYINRSPIVAPLKTLGEPEAERLGISMSLCLRHFESLRGRAGLIEKVQEAFDSYDFEENDDPDFQLYSGDFFSDADRASMQEVTAADPLELPRFSGSFQDDRLDEMLLRYRGRNWPDSLSADEAKFWQKYCAERWQVDNRRQSVGKELSELISNEKGEKLPVLEDLRDYLELL